MRRPALAVLLLLACGKPHIPPVTHVDGTVHGVGFARPSAIWLEHDDRDPRLIVLTDVSAACTHVASRRQGERPVVWADGGPRAALVFQGDDRAFIDLGGDAGVVTADSASVRLWEQTETTVTGEFTAKFGTEAVSGELVAEECKQLQGYCGCSVVGFAAPLLALALLTRRRARQSGGMVQENSRT